MVAHPSHGGCIIQGICDRKILGEAKQYYVLIPQSEPQTTILDPVDSAQKIGLHKIMSSEQADQLLTYAVDAEPEWVKDNAVRRKKYAETLRSGNLREIASMIKELCLREMQSSLNQYDKTALRNAQKKLLSEIALAKGIGFDNALELMNQAIRVSVS